MFNIVLVEPEIPPNTGNVIRLAANTGAALHLVEPLGFSMEDRMLRRAGLDYHEFADVRRHASWPAFLAAVAPEPDRLFAFSTEGKRAFAEVAWRPGDWLVFGSETAGLKARDTGIGSANAAGPPAPSTRTTQPQPEQRRRRRRVRGLATERLRRRRLGA